MSYHYDYLGKKSYKWCYFYFVLIILIQLTGFRFRIGLDTIRYESHFIDTPNFFNLNSSEFQESNHEPLYLILSALAKTISSEFWVLQVLQSILVNTIVFRFIRLNTKNVFLGVLLYYICLYLNFNCEVMREACAVSMLLLGWEYLKKDKILPFAVFCIIACGFHISGILLLIIPILKLTPFWKFLKINKYTIPILVGILLVGYFIQAKFFDYLVLLSLGDSFSGKVERYADSSLASGVLNINGIISSICRYILLPLLSIYILKRKNKYHFNDNFEPMVLFSLIFAVLTIPIAIFYRYANYFMPFAIIAICQFVYTPKLYLTKKKYVRLKFFLSWYIILFPLLFFQIYGFNAKEGDSRYKTYMRYYPYSSIFTKEKDALRESLFNYRNAI